MADKIVKSELSPFTSDAVLFIYISTVSVHLIFLDSMFPCFSWKAKLNLLKMGLEFDSAKMCIYIYFWKDCRIQIHVRVLNFCILVHYLNHFNSAYSTQEKK